MTDLDGVWNVERVSGVLPPMKRVRKRISGERGTTVVGPIEMPFRITGLSLRYGGLFSGFVDYLEPEGDGFAGRATLFDREYGRFRMTRIT